MNLDQILLDTNSDSDTDDSDYKDEDEINDNNDDDNKNLLENLPLEEITHKRKRIADELWNEMNKDETEYINTRMQKAVTPFYQQKVFKTKVNVAKSNNVKDMLNLIFKNSTTNINNNDTSNKTKSIENTSSLKDDISKAVKSLKHQGKVIEKVKFAGQEILYVLNDTFYIATLIF